LFSQKHEIKLNYSDNNIITRCTARDASHVCIAMIQVVLITIEAILMRRRVAEFRRITGHPAFASHVTNDARIYFEIWSRAISPPLDSHDIPAISGPHPVAHIVVTLPQGLYVARWKRFLSEDALRAPVPLINGETHARKNAYHFRLTN